MLLILLLNSALPPTPSLDTEDNYAITDLMCWMDIESFRRTPYLEANKRDSKAKDIKSKYLNKKYFFGPNSPASRPQQNLVRKRLRLLSCRVLSEWAFRLILLYKTIKRFQKL